MELTDIVSQINYITLQNNLNIYSLQELKEIIGKQLTSGNSQIPDGLVEFSYAHRAFVSLPPPDNLVVFYESQGTLLHRDSEEAHQQMIEQGIDRKYLFFVFL